MPKAPSSDLKRLRAALETNSPPAIRQQCRRMAVIGCGRCDECDLLLELFPFASLCLIDADPTAIADLMRRYAAPTRVCPILGDARQLKSIAPGPYDFTLIRHPDLDAQREVWDTVFSAAVRQMAVHSLLVVCTYTAAEAEGARQIARALPLKETGPAEMLDAPVALAGNDRYILLYVRT